LRELGQIPRDLADISRKVLQESLEDSDTASE